MCQNNCNTLKLTHEELQSIATVFECLEEHPDIGLNNLELNLLRKIERHLKKDANDANGNS